MREVEQSRPTCRCETSSPGCSSRCRARAIPKLGDSQDGRPDIRAQALERAANESAPSDPDCGATLLLALPAQAQSLKPQAETTRPEALAPGHDHAQGDAVSPDGAKRALRRRKG